MSAIAAIKAARAAGVELALDGDDLALKAASAPPAPVLDALSRHKTEIMVLLRPGCDGWSAEDWHVFFDERAGIVEFDGGLPRAKAEAQAFACCIVEWLNRNPERSPAGRCLECGDREHAHDSLLPYGVEPTGHALPPPNPEGPFPLNLFMAPGEAGLQEMIASTERGLLVTRFHYTNIVHPVESTITGMTRDGTFLIEDGEIAHPVKNLRFTQSIIEALHGTEMVSRDTELASEFFFSASRVPALKVSSFNFSGRSDH